MRYNFGALEKEDFDQITEITNIKHLELEKTTLKNGEWSKIQNLTKLENLLIPGNNINSDDWISFSNLPALKKLDVSRMALNEELELENCGFKSLENLNYLHNECIEKDLTWISKIDSLKSLSVNFRKINCSKGFEIIRNLEKLESLSFSNTTVDQSATEALSKLKSLGKTCAINCEYAKEVLEEQCAKILGTPINTTYSLEIQSDEEIRARLSEQAAKIEIKQEPEQNINPLEPETSSIEELKTIF